MNNLLTLLQVRPVWVSLLGAVLTIGTYLTWPVVMPNESRRGVWVVFGILLLWTLIEWTLYVGRYLRERASRQGQLRVQLDGAFRQLVRECERSGSAGRSDSAVGLPWLLSIGAPASGKSQVLSRAGFRRIASCGSSELPGLCTLWLSQDAARPAVCVELVGAASSDTESCAQVYAWLTSLRGAPDAILFQVSLDQLDGGSHENAASLAVQLSPLLRGALVAFNRHEIPVYVLVGKCDQLEGLGTFFPTVERRPWGFRIDRPLHTDVPIDLLGARLGSFADALWRNLGTALTEAQGRPEAVEELLDFPREVERHMAQVGAFLSKLCQQFTPETRARLCEVLLLSAGPPGGAIHEAERHRRIPGFAPRSEAAKPGSEATVSHRFVIGAMSRILGQLGTTASARAPRQNLAVWAAALTCVLCVALMTRWFVAKRQPLRRLAGTLALVQKSAEELIKLRSTDEILPGSAQTRENLARFLDRDRGLSLAQSTLEQQAKDAGIKLTSETGTALGSVASTAMSLRQCESAGRLLGPLVRYSPLDVRRKLEQPLYDRMLRFSAHPAGKRKGAAPARADLADRNGLADWLESVYALVMIQRSSAECASPQRSQDAPAALSRYFTSLWLGKDVDLGPVTKVCAQPTDSPAQRLCQRLLEVFSQYLRSADSCQGLRWLPDEEALKASQTQLSAYADPSLAATDGVDIYGGILFTLRALEVSDQAQQKSAPLPTFKFFRPGGGVGVEYMRRSCNAIFRSGGSRSSRLSCLLRSDLVNTNLSMYQEQRMGAYYAQRNAAAWGDFLAGIKRAPPVSATAGNRLQELADEIPNLLSDLPVLFRTLGGGDGAPGERQEDPCREARRVFLPFRWAIGEEDDGSGQPGIADLGRTWTAYQRDLRQLQAQLAALAQPAQQPPAVTMKSLRMILDGMGQMSSSRQNWLHSLRTQLKQPGRPEAVVKLETIDRFEETLREFEGEILALLLKRASQTTHCRVRTLSQEIATLLPPAGTPRDAAYQQQMVQAIQNTKQQLTELRTQFFDVFAESSQQCGMRSFDEKRQYPVPLQEACYALKTVERQLTARPQQQPAQAEPKFREPSLIPTPEQRQCDGSAIGSVVLEIPEVNKRYICNVSGMRCKEEGAPKSNSVLVRLERPDRTAIVELSPRGGLRGLLSLPVGASIQEESRQVDPWQRGSPQRRYSTELALGVACKSPGLKLRMYFDEEFVHKVFGGGREPEVLRAGLLDAVLSKLEACP